MNKNFVLYLLILGFAPLTASSKEKKTSTQTSVTFNKQKTVHYYEKDDYVNNADAMAANRLENAQEKICYEKDLIRERMANEKITYEIFKANEKAKHENRSRINRATLLEQRHEKTEQNLQFYQNTTYALSAALVTSSLYIYFKKK